MNRARQAAQAGQLEDALKTLEHVLTAVPTNRNALAFAAQIAQRQGFNTIAAGDRPKGYSYFPRCAAYMRKLAEAHKDLNPQEKELLQVTIYNEACAFAIAGQPDKAIAALTEAFEAGFPQADMLVTDKDFDSIRSLPKFQELVAARVKSFDFTFELPNLDGKTVSLADYKGKVLIVDIWGTWCGPCQKEIPHFVELHKKYKDKGLEIVGINYEEGTPEEVKQRIKDFATKNGITYTCVLGDDKTRDQVPNFQGYPTTIFIDRTGKVRFKVVGYHSLEDLESWATGLLDEKAGPVAN
jgi:thiol-disulfide isomerase/thioredoxin